MPFKVQRIKGVIFASITAFFWGFLAIALKVAAGIMDPVTIVWFRFVVAFTILFVYYIIVNPSYLGKNEQSKKKSLLFSRYKRLNFKYMPQIHRLISNNYYEYTNY